MAYKREQSFGIVPVYQEEGQWRFLLVQHSRTRQRAKKDNEGAGHWAFPKGHAEKGEEPLESARRELAEETGIHEVEVRKEATFSEKYFFTSEGRTISKVVTYFLGIVKNPAVRIQEEEISDYRWAPYEEALKLATFENAQNIIKQASAYLAGAH